jgi:hypothetical protein
MSTQVETMTIHKLALSEPVTLEAPAPVQLAVPQDVVSKFGVESVTKSTEELIAEKNQ